MLPPHKVRLNKKSTTLRLTMIFKQPLNSLFLGCALKKNSSRTLLHTSTKPEDSGRAVTSMARLFVWGNLFPGNAKKHQKIVDYDNKSARLLLIQMEKTNFASAIHSNRLSKQ